MASRGKKKMDHVGGTYGGGYGRSAAGSKPKSLSKMPKSAKPGDKGSSSKESKRDGKDVSVLKATV